MQKYLIFAVGLIVLVVLFSPALDHLAVAGPSSDTGSSSGDVGKPEIATSVTVPAGASAPNGNAVTIARDGSGQFHITAEVNSHPVRFLVDTGADGIALTEADAAAAGLSINPSAYTQVATTASGPGYGARVRLDRLEIAGQDVSGVDAVVLRGLGASLLGQSVLRRMGSVTINGDQMVVGH